MSRRSNQRANHVSGGWCTLDTFPERMHCYCCSTTSTMVALPACGPIYRRARSPQQLPPTVHRSVYLMPGRSSRCRLCNVNGKCRLSAVDSRVSSPLSNTMCFFSRLIMSTSLLRNLLGGVGGTDADAAFFIVACGVYALLLWMRSYTAGCNPHERGQK